MIVNLFSVSWFWNEKGSSVGQRFKANTCAISVSCKLSWGEEKKTKDSHLITLWCNAKIRIGEVQAKDLKIYGQR